MEQRPLAVITGASSGIGESLARQFVQNDFDVVIAAEDARIHDTAAALRANGAEVTAAQVNLATLGGVSELHRAIVATGRAVEAIALNAGIGVGGEFVRTELERDLELIALNVTSVVHLAKLVLPAMVERRSGRMLITASIASTMPGPYYATYAASKSFLLSFAQAIRHELRDTGVTVTALMPGPTDTRFFERAGLTDTLVGRGPKDDPDDVARDGYEALMAGDDHVVAGSLKNRVQTTAAKVLPLSANAALHGRMTRPKAPSP
jgi:short-subunit dehydrogenase